MSAQEDSSHNGRATNRASASAAASVEDRLSMDRDAAIRTSSSSTARDHHTAYRHDSMTSPSLAAQGNGGGGRDEEEQAAEDDARSIVRGEGRTGGLPAGAASTSHHPHSASSGPSPASSSYPSYLSAAPAASYSHQHPRYPDPPSAAPSRHSSQHRSSYQTHSYAPYYQQAPTQSSSSASSRHPDHQLPPNRHPSSVSHQQGYRRSDYEREYEREYDQPYEYDYDYEHGYDPRSGSRAEYPSARSEYLHHTRHHRQAEYEREYLEHQQAAASDPRYARSRPQASYSPTAPHRTPSSQAQQNLYQDDYSRSHMMEEDEHVAASRRSPVSSRHAPAASYAHHAYPSRPPSTTPLEPHYMRSGPVYGLDPRRAAAGHSSRSAATTPSPRVQPSYYHRGAAVGSAGLAPPIPGHATSGGPVGGHHLTAHSPSRHSSASPHQVQRALVQQRGPHAYAAGPRSQYADRAAAQDPGLAEDSAPKSSMSIMNMLNSSRQGQSSALPSPERESSPVSHQHEYEMDERYRRHTGGGDPDVVMAQAGRYAPEAEERPRFSRTETSGSSSSAAAAVASRQREDMAAAALLSVAGIPPPATTPSQGQSTFAPIPSVPSRSGGSKQALSRGSALAPPSVFAPPPGGTYPTSSSSRRNSVDPGSSPVAMTAPGLPHAPTTATGAATKKTLKLKSRPLPPSSTRLSYSHAPPPPVTTPTGDSAAGKGGTPLSSRKSRGGKVKDEAHSAALSKDGWDSDLDSDANAPLWQNAIEQYATSVHVRRAFLRDASEEHANVRSGMSWERLSAAYGKRHAYVMDAVRSREEKKIKEEKERLVLEVLKAKAKAKNMKKTGAEAGPADSSANAASSSGTSKKRGKATKASTTTAADEDVDAALLSTLAGEDADENEAAENDDVDMLLAAEAEAATQAQDGQTKAAGSSKKGARKSESAAAALNADETPAKKGKAVRKSRSKAALAAAKADKDAKVTGTLTPSSSKASPSKATRLSSVAPPSSPLAGSIAGLDESLANELLSTAVGGDPSDEDDDSDEEDDESRMDEDEDEAPQSEDEGKSSLAAKRKKLTAAIMSSGKGKGRASAASSAPGSKSKKRKRDIDVHDLSGSASRAGSAAIAAALAGDGSRTQTPLRAMSTDFGDGSPGPDLDGEGVYESSVESESDDDGEDAEQEVEEEKIVNPNKPLGVNSAASHPLWTRDKGLVVLEPSRISRLEDLHKKIWTNIAKRDIPKVYRTSQSSYNNKIQYWKRISTMAQREGKKGMQRNQKTVKDVQARARRVVREMLTFWKKNEKEERELRKKAEKEAMEKAKKEEEMREAKRQARKLNFLITQTELYSHFVGSKLKTSEAEESEETSGGAAKGTSAGTEMKEAVTASTSKQKPLGPVDGTTLVSNSVPGNLADIDFDDEDESNLRAHAARNAQQAVEEAKQKARAFDVQAAEDRKKNEALLAEYEDGGDEQAPPTGGKMIEEKDLGKAFDSDDMNFQNPTSMGAMDLKQPKMLTCQLKEYQLKGLNWLANLYEQGINGILADEMGLGKTVQSISLMAYLAEVHDIWGPFLVIAPASTLHNWQQEITRFVPTLKALPYWGNVKDRQVLRKFWNRKQIAYNRDSPFHVLVTSYQLVVSDEAYFKRVNWQYMVLDEAQAIKSSQSNRWKSLLSFNCRNRLLLTGTPVQNSMQELWALLHFIMPSLFDSHDEFSEWFSKDIESHAENKSSALNEHQLRRLHMILKPFMLRRIKKNVQNELGDKIEIDIFCEMSARQRMLYRSLRTAVSAQDIIDQANGNETGLKHLMNLVMQFRKVCNHPELFERADVSTPFAFASSAKSGSIAREGDFLFLLDSTRSLIELEVPKLFYEAGGFLDVPAQQSRAGFDTKYLDNLFNIWRADHIQRSLLQDSNSAFASLPLLNVTPGDAERAYCDPTIEKVIRDVEKDRQWEELEAFAIDDDFAAAQLRPFGLVRKPTPKVRELTRSTLLPLDGVSADYRQYSILAQPGARAIIPPAVAPPPEMVASSRTIAERQAGYKRDDLVSLALYGLDADSRESETRVERVRSVLPGLPPRGLLAESSSDQLPASNMQIPQMNKFIVDSSKLARLDSLLRELKAGGHRCLIYFQMTRMIDLMEEYLIYRQYKYLRLDGASKISDRRDMVTDWQTNPELFVFLLSTRAGGLGINLTAADTVIFYDHDWNPSNDSQAMDRAHRLGQTKQVTVYRLITKGTIDERIVKLARNKKEVQDIVVGNKAYTESGMAKPQEIVSLLLDDDELAESILRKKQAEEAQTAEQKADMMRALHARRRQLRQQGEAKEASPAPARDSLAWTLDEDEDDFFGAKPTAPKADDEEETGEAGASTAAAGKKKKAASGGGSKKKKASESNDDEAPKPKKAKAKAAANKKGANAEASTAGGEGANGDASVDGVAPPAKKRKPTERKKKTAEEVTDTSAMTEQ
ncbi:putative DNA helicase ino80 [Tilletia horrida]|uniref:Chromatin-remodeling ATPase INO80 n=1 Tax=Tilletia horrida TaxID=155126 RepID=A0AAN6GTE2_9BASI|nr:putative DNA helicase ino80 [Tilletia horrida]KAK0555148.1 putative DNA helicase ino80 [Tilletia horrida]KAK0568418.1 putative DNA helicase ino80 [Tilletia horrida]